MFIRYAKYLEAKINGWYANAAIDYGVSGRFVAVEDQAPHLKITWEEEGETFTTSIPWYADYTPEQAYNIWMECELGGKTMKFTPEQLTQVKMALCEHIATTASQITTARQAGWDEAADMMAKAYADSVAALRILNEEEA